MFSELTGPRTVIVHGDLIDSVSQRAHSFFGGLATVFASVFHVVQSCVAFMLQGLAQGLINPSDSFGIV